MSTQAGSQSSTFSAAREQRREVRSTAPLPLRLLVPLSPAAAFALGAFLVGLAILLVALKPIAATLIASVPLLLGGLWMLAAGMWNEAHRGEVAAALGAQRQATQASLRRHPVFWLTVVPVLAAARAIERMETSQSHPGLVVVLVVGLGMWVLGVVAVAFRIRRARGAAGT